MDDRQINRLAMYRNVLSMMATPANKSKFDTLASIEPRRAALAEQVAAIEEQANIQVRDTKGATAAKKALEAQLEALAYKACENLQVFADDSGKVDLATKYDLKMYKLMGLRDEELVTKTGDIIADAETYKAELAGLRFSDANLATLKSLQIAYKESLSANPNLVDMRAAATDALALLFPQAKEAVEKLDKAVNLLKDDHPQLVSLYFQTRNIADLGG